MKRIYYHRFKQKTIENRITNQLCGTVERKNKTVINNAFPIEFFRCLLLSKYGHSSCKIGKENHPSKKLTRNFMIKRWKIFLLILLIVVIAHAILIDN